MFYWVYFINLYSFVQFFLNHILMILVNSGCAPLRPILIIHARARRVIKFWAADKRAKREKWPVPKVACWNLCARDSAPRKFIAIRGNYLQFDCNISIWGRARRLQINSPKKKEQSVNFYDPGKFACGNQFTSPVCIFFLAVRNTF